LLGILREENCTAAEILQQHGLRLDAIREELARSPMPVERRITHEMESELPNPVLYAMPKRIAEALWILNMVRIQSQAKQR
jgi:hypothetical protein